MIHLAERWTELAAVAFLITIVATVIFFVFVKK